MPPTPQSNDARIRVLKAELGATRREFKAQLGFLNDKVDEIKDNHLKHIANSISGVKNDLKGIYKKIGKLNAVDKKDAWLINLLKKVVEVIVIAIVVAVLVMIGIKAT